MKWERPFCIVREPVHLRDLAVSLVPDLATALADSEVRQMILGAALSDDDHPGIRDDLKIVENFIRDMIRESELLLIGMDAADQEKAISPVKAPYLVFNWLASTVTDKRNGTVWVDVRVEPPKGEASVVLEPVAEPARPLGVRDARYANMQEWMIDPAMRDFFHISDDTVTALARTEVIFAAAAKKWPKLWKGIKSDTFKKQLAATGDTYEGYGLAAAFKLSHYVPEYTARMAENADRKRRAEAEAARATVKKAIKR